MKRSLLFLTALLALSAAQAQTPAKVKTKAKTEIGTVLKTRTDAAPIVLDGPIRRVETLSGIELLPAPDGKTILLSFSQQLAQPGTLVVTNYKKQAIFTAPLTAGNSAVAPVSLGRIPAGSYLVEAKSGNYVYWKKVMVRYR